MLIALIKKAAAVSRGGSRMFAEGSSTNKTAAIAGGCCLNNHRGEEINSVFGRPGSDLLSRVLRRTTIGAEEFYGRVRDGIGYRLLAETTRSAKDGIEASVRAANAQSSGLTEDLAPQALVYFSSKFVDGRTNPAMTKGMSIEDKSD